MTLNLRYAYPMNVMVVDAYPMNVMVVDSRITNLLSLVEEGSKRDNKRALR